MLLLYQFIQIIFLLKLQSSQPSLHPAYFVLMILMSGSRYVSGWIHHTPILVHIPLLRWCVRCLKVEEDESSNFDAQPASTHL